MPFVDRYGRVQQGPARPPLLTDTQRTIAALVGVLVLPGFALRSWRAMRAEEAVDLSRFQMRAQPFDTPAIEKHDGTVRIEFCAS